MAAFPKDLPIPPRPIGAEPNLKPGWQWLPAEWLAYWVMRSNPISNRVDLLYGACQGIREYAAVLEWWQNDPIASKAFERIKILQPREITQQLLWQFAQEAGLDMTEYSDVESELNQRANHLLYAMSTVVGADFLSIVATNCQVVSGRHRMYAAWKCNVERLLVWVIA